MKAWLLDDLSGLTHLHLAEAPDPTPADTEVVIDLEYAALNPADRYLAQNQYPAKPTLPHILGRDGVGIISAVGKTPGSYQIGQRVLIIRGETGVNRWGTFAQRVAVAADSLTTVPTGWSGQESAGAALVYLTAYQSLTQWGDLPPSVVLITGASGGVGVASIQLAKAMNHTVIALSRGPSKRKSLLELGADHIVDASDPQWPATVKKILSPRRVDLAIDNIGGIEFGRIIETLGNNGKVSVVGMLAGPMPQFNTATLLFRRIRVGGVAVGTYSRSEAHTAWNALVPMLAKTNAKPLVDRIFPFDQLPAAFDRLAAGPIGKVLIQIPPV